jgi:DNA-binding transcriptional regulator YhcF (GntR family)
MKTGQHKYTKVADDILRRIDSGELAPGSRLPGVREVGEHFDCNYHTVRHAYAGLAQQGYLELKPGSGTFVTDKAVNYLKRKVSTDKILRTTDQLGMLLPLKQWGHYVTSLINQLHHSAAKQDLKLNIRTVSSIDIQSAALASEFSDQGCCAIILPWIGKDQQAVDLHDFVRSSELPVVLPDLIHGLEAQCYHAPKQRRNNVPNETILQGRYFQSLGYKKVALLGEYADAPEHFQSKVIQYVNWVNHEGLPNLLELAEVGEVRNFDRIIDRWLPMKGKLAVIAYHDELALEFMDACRQRDVDIPSDFAVLGHNNNPDGLRSDPALSSMLCPYEYIADGMIAHAQALSSGSSAQLQDQDPHAFHIRESCGGRQRIGDRVDEIVAALLDSFHKKQQLADACQTAF